ncbi:hypothetical protein BDW59DRAFT_42710 [Aspergillus cavernicola]|uniref:Secreted protein n=1 Tax=Aspergillus cavernicola TaxID=176166 RepID=A0ABR4ILN9_9EURO
MTPMMTIDLISGGIVCLGTGAWGRLPRVNSLHFWSLMTSVAFEAEIFCQKLCHQPPLRYRSIVIHHPVASPVNCIKSIKWVN